jgi:hypothetical protein
VNQSETNVALRTPFWPLVLLALSMATFLGWQVMLSQRQHTALLQLAGQQTLLVGQAKQTESRLQAMMMDLLTLSKTDPNAKAIVNKFGIKYNPAPSAVRLPDVTQPRTKPNSGSGAVPKPPTAESGATDL